MVLFCCTWLLRIALVYLAHWLVTCCTCSDVLHKALTCALCSVTLHGVMSRCTGPGLPQYGITRCAGPGPFTQVDAPFLQLFTFDVPVGPSSMVRSPSQQCMYLGSPTLPSQHQDTSLGPFGMAPGMARAASQVCRDSRAVWFAHLKASRPSCPFLFTCWHSPQLPRLCLCAVAVLPCASLWEGCMWPMANKLPPDDFVRACCA